MGNRFSPIQKGIESFHNTFNSGVILPGCFELVMEGFQRLPLFFNLLFQIISCFCETISLHKYIY